jgi:hypothetical protein
MTSNRDLLRSKTLGRAVQFRTNTVDYFPEIYTEVDGKPVFQGFEETPIKVMVKQPSVKERNKLVAACKDETGKLDEMEFILQAAIMFTFDPETGERLYDAKDYDVLAEQPAGGFVDQFGGEAIQMLNLGKPKAKAETSAKT